MVPWPEPSALNCGFCDLNHREHDLDPFIRLIDAPDAEEVIAYKMPGFRIGKSTVAGYAAFSKQCGLYLPHAAIASCAGEIAAAGLKATRTGVTFSPGKPIPDKLIKKLALAARKVQLALRRLVGGLTREPRYGASALNAVRITARKDDTERGAFAFGRFELEARIEHLAEPLHDRQTNAFSRGDSIPGRSQ
jgi:uncharacterized protein YdhG (YjbR/CyaY superfamily)